MARKNNNNEVIQYLWPNICGGLLEDIILTSLGLFTVIPLQQKDSQKF